MPLLSSQAKPRYYLIDSIRALAMISMIFFHFSYDVFMIYGVDTGWYGRPAVHIWQQSICWTFLFVAGISMHFSHSNLKHGIFLNLCGLLVTAVTLLFLPSETVWFGVLNCIGCCILAAWLGRRALERIPAPAGLFLSFLLFALLRHVPEGYLALPGLRFSLPSGLYAFRPMTVLGFPYPGFRSSDYFPLLPWIFLFLAGYFFWDLAQKSERLLSLFRLRIPVLHRLGTVSVWVYLAHQPVLMLLCQLIFCGAA